MCGVIALPYYNTGKDDGAQAAHATILQTPNTTLADLAFAAATHRVETHALIASTEQSLRYDDIQHYKAGFVTGYQGAILAAIGERATVSEEATLAL